MTGESPSPRRYVPVAGSEAETLIGSLERERAIVEWKCGGVDAAGLRATVGSSSMTLGGILKHLALVEDEYFTRRLLGRAFPPPWDAIDWESDPDWEWRTGSEDDPLEVLALWQSAVQRSRDAVAEALRHGGLDQLIHHGGAEGEFPSLRRMLVDMIEEYARHAGHADVIRESVDGLVGEGPPS